MCTGKILFHLITFYSLLGGFPIETKISYIIRYNGSWKFYNNNNKLLGFNKEHTIVFIPNDIDFIIIAHYVKNSDTNDVYKRYVCRLGQ